MTGEITLRGRVLPIGGLKEKALAALRSEIRNVIIPERNKKDLEEIPEPLRKEINFIFAKTMEDVLDSALVGGLKVRNLPGKRKKSKKPRQKRKNLPVRAKKPKRGKFGQNRL